MQTNLPCVLRGSNGVTMVPAPPLGDVNRSQRCPVGMILHAGWREKAAGPSNAFHHHHPKGPLLEPYFDTQAERRDRMVCRRKKRRRGKRRRRRRREERMWVIEWEKEGLGENECEGRKEKGTKGGKSRKRMQAKEGKGIEASGRRRTRKREKKVGV